MVAWLLKTPIQTEYGPGVRFMAKRPAGKGPQERYHCGIDIEAVEGAPVLAPEPLTIVDTDRGWQGSAKATLVHTDSGFSLLFGCTALGASPPVGTHLNTGGMLAAVGYYTKEDDTHTSMLHFQVYGKLMTPTEVNHSQEWPLGQVRPDGLIDPMEYLALGVVPQKDVPPADPAGQQVEASGGFTNAAPCPIVNGQSVCLVNQVEAWYQALLTYSDLAAQALNISAGLVDSGKISWTPAANAAVTQIEEAMALLNLYEGEGLSGLPNQQVAALVVGCQKAKAARATLLAFNTSVNAGKGGASSSGGSSALIILGGVAIAGVVTAAVFAFTRKSKRRAA